MDTVSNIEKNWTLVDIENANEYLDIMSEAEDYQIKQANKT